MRIAQEHIELFNKQIQDLSGFAVADAESVKPGSGGQLFEEFSRILDKIASKVQTLQVNQAHNYWAADKEVFAAQAAKPVAKSERKSVASEDLVDEKVTADKSDKPEKSDKKPVAPVCTGETSKAHVETKKDTPTVSSDSPKDVVTEHKGPPVMATSAEAEKEQHVADDTGDQQAASDDLVDIVELTELPISEVETADTATESEIVYATSLQADTQLPDDVEDNVVAEVMIDTEVEAEVEVDAEILDDAAPAEQFLATKSQTSDEPTVVEKTNQPVATEVVSEAEIMETVAEADFLTPKTQELADQFSQKVMERLLEKFANAVDESPKLANPLEQIARLAVELSMPLKVDQQVLSSALNIAQNASKLGAEASQAINTAVSSSSGSNNFSGAQTQLNQFTRASEQQGETQRLPRSFASRTLTRVEEALKEVAKSKDGKSISLRLDPPSLGSVRIDIRVSDGVLTAKLRAENPQVALLLREHGFDIQSTLRKLGLAVDQIKVSVGHEPNGEQQFQEFFNGNQTNRDSKQSNWSETQVADETLNVANDLGDTNSVVDHWVA